MMVFPAACGAGVAIGLLGVIMGSREKGASRRGPRSPNARPLAIGTIAALVVGTAAGLVTGWPVAALMGGAAAITLPSLVRRSSTVQSTARIEAIAVWTELLRDSLSASSGLSGALITTAQIAPRAIQVHVTALAERLSSGMHMDQALHQFALEVDDSSADLVVCALLLAATSRSQRLGDLLSSLAESIRDEVAMRLRIEASRASARSGVRSVIVFSLLFVAFLLVVARAYLSPFGTTLGQGVLLVVGLLYAAGIYVMVRLVRPPTPVRLLQAPAPR